MTPIDDAAPVDSAPPAVPADASGAVALTAPGAAASPLAGVAALLLLPLLSPPGAAAQQEAPGGPDPVFHTFSIVASDPGTGEVGVAVTTRNDCVGNRVPHARAGVGAVATQAWTRYEYGPEILDLLERGTSPEEALRRALADDTLAHRRQVGVIGAGGATAQHTGSAAPDWSGERSGPRFAAQGNILVGAGVLDSVAASFESTAGSGRPLADRLVAALEAGQRAGGDSRDGRIQSAAVLVADPREDASPRPGGVTADIHVCEHPTPVAELRRVRDRVAGELGHRALELTRGDDVWQLHVMLHALGHYRPSADSIPRSRASRTYTERTAEAVDAFRAERGLSTGEDGSPAGLVDRRTVDALWEELESRGLAVALRERFAGVVRVRR